VYAFIAAGLQAMRAFSSRTAGPVFGHLIFGIWMVVQGIELRRAGKTVDSAFPEKQPA
jgi:hypothetical protein